jgi:hypothetical protein
VSVPAVEAMLSAELWVSFISLLRSYVAAAGLNLEETAEVFAGDDRVGISVAGARLDLNYSAVTGAGTWCLCGAGAEERQGRFELLPEGRIVVDGKTLDLDHAAIDFAAFVMQTGKQE